MFSDNFRFLCRGMYIVEVKKKKPLLHKFWYILTLYENNKFANFEPAKLTLYNLSPTWSKHLELTRLKTVKDEMRLRLDSLKHIYKLYIRE